MKNKAKMFVVLEHVRLPNRGLRFFTTNSDDNTHGYTGELWYKEVGFAETPEEALHIINQWDPHNLPTYSELEEYYKQLIDDRHGII